MEDSILCTNNWVNMANPSSKLLGVFWMDVIEFSSC